MENHNLLIGVAVGVTCGACIGWVVRGKLLRKNLVANYSNSVAAGSSSETSIMSDDVRGEYKMVLVVRSDLKMGKGKIAAQCGHAAVECYIEALENAPEIVSQWEHSSQPKICVKVENEELLLELAKHARSLNLTAAVIQDAGRTQIAPGSRTVLGIGPGPSSQIDKVTGHLKLM